MLLIAFEKLVGDITNAEDISTLYSLPTMYACMNIKRIILTTFILLVFTGSALAHSPHDVINAIDLSPSYAEDNTLFIYVLGRLQKSTDGGYSWKELINGLDATPYTVSSIIVSPTYPLDNTVFVSSLESGVSISQ